MPQSRTNVSVHVDHPLLPLFTNLTIKCGTLTFAALSCFCFRSAHFDSTAPWIDLRPTAVSNQPLQSAPPPQHTHFIPTPAPDEQGAQGSDVSSYLSVTRENSGGGASAGVELTSLPPVDDSRPITCILDDYVIDCFAEVCLCSATTQRSP